MYLLGQADAAIAESLSDELGWTRYAVLGAYLLILLVLGLWGWYRSAKGEEDYYLAGRRQGWFVSSLTIMSTFFSSFALLGAPGMVYREGVVFALFSLNVPVGALTVYLIGGRIWAWGRRFGYVTPGDMVADYYASPVALRLLVAATGFLYAIPYVVMQIQAGGIVAKELFGEEHFNRGAIILAAITMVYIMVGGMRSVAWTDVLQGGLLISGMLVCGLAMFLLFDGPAQFGRQVMRELPDSSLTAPGNTGEWGWSRTMTLCILASSGSMIQPAQWMRYYSAGGLEVLRRSAVIFAIVLTSCFLLGVMLIGLAGQVLYPLEFRVTVPIDEAPRRLDAECPAPLADRFLFVVADETGDTSDRETVKGQVQWRWQGKDLSVPGDAEMRALKELSDNDAYRAALDRLQERLSRIASHQVTPADRPEVWPHSAVDPDPSQGKDFDSIIVVVLGQQMPRVLKRFGALFASLMLVAIMAASMSTADSNLHALSAVFTRDIHDQFINPRASEARRVLVGRVVILAATLLALAIVIGGRQPAISSRYDILNMIAKMGFMAIAFSAQLLPLTLDMLFVRRGTAVGAAAGLAAGLLGVCLFGPPLLMVRDALGSPETLSAVAAGIERIKTALNVDPSVWGLLINVPVFVLISLVTRKPSEEHLARFREPHST